MNYEQKKQQVINELNLEIHFNKVKREEGVIFVEFRGVNTNIEEVILILQDDKKSLYLDKHSQMRGNYNSFFK